MKNFRTLGWVSQCLCWVYDKCSLFLIADTREVKSVTTDSQVGPACAKKTCQGSGIQLLEVSATEPVVLGSDSGAEL